MHPSHNLSEVFRLLAKQSDEPLCRSLDGTIGVRHKEKSYPKGKDFGSKAFLGIKTGFLAFILALNRYHVRHPCLVFARPYALFWFRLSNFWANEIYYPSNFSGIDSINGGIESTMDSFVVRAH